MGPTGVNIDTLNNTADSLVDSLANEQVYGVADQENLPHGALTEDTTVTVQPMVIAMEPAKKQRNIEAWQTLTLIFTLFLVGFVRAFNNNRTIQSMRALFNYSVAQEIVREEKVFFHRGNLVLTLVHLLNTALFLHFIIERWGVFNRFSSLELFGLLVLLIAFTYVIKYVFSKVLFFVLNGSSLSIEYIFNVCLYNNLLGILLLPLLAISFFTSADDLFMIRYLMLPVIGLTVVLRLFRLTRIGNANGVSYLYIFLYICTLEILPLVVLYRIFIQ